MSTKQKAATKKVGLDAIAKDQRQERKLIGDMIKRERIMKWILIGIAILLLLLILFLGYATDWLKGISKDDAVGTTGISAANDANTTPNGTAGTGSTGTNGTTNNGSTTGTSSTNTTGTNSSNTSKETSSTSTTTNNTTTNNTTTPTPSSSLLSLYTDSSVGDNISGLLDNASLLGISKTCHTEVLIQVCDFTDGNATITTKNLLGTGIVTSITKDF